MNIKEYIASGILDEYVLGLLSEEEKQAVEAYAAQEPAIVEEIRKIEESLELYAFAEAKMPKNDIKSKILAEIEADEHQNKTKSTTKIVEMKPKRTFSYPMAAAIAGLMISVGANITLYQKWIGAKERIAILQKDNARVVEDYEIIRTSNESKEKQLAIITDVATKKLILKGTPNHIESQLTVFWKPDNQAVIASIDKLPPAPAGKQYQLWAIGKNGPVDAGVLNDSIAGFQQMKSIDEAVAFAITLEKAGGSPSPTLDEMYALGQF